MQKEFTSRLEDIDELMVVSLRGIKGTDNNNLRRQLREREMYLNVVKNSLAGRAFDELGRGCIRELLTGPSAVVYGGDSIVDVAKLLVEWGEKIENLNIKGGYLGGKMLDSEAVKALSKLPSRTELQGMVVMLANAPGSCVAAAICSPAGIIAGCIKTVIKNLEAA